ncbi:hypothetical protein [Prauserella cavernicola]|uniref:Uncharacterized protein n=1 Tax=Prauserella cavernicola TaxID=2800127 RepID=A0A934QV48_9PSEU|nr:hypothetical protein [Prauserella cavernicola]MBK1787131.1 hypothetical protein [Prauserella cavernicola]
MSITGSTRGDRFRERAGRIARPTFTISLLCSMVLGTVVVLVQLAGSLLGAGGLVTGVADTLGPAAFVLATLACVVSLVLGYTRPGRDTEADS